MLPPSVAMSWILVDGDGWRFVNEYEPYGHDTGHLGLDGYDATTRRFPAVPAFVTRDLERGVEGGLRSQ